MAKAEIIETGKAPELADVAGALESSRNGDGAGEGGAKRKPGRPPGSGTKKRVRKAEPAAAPAEDPAAESIAQYAMLYTFLMTGASRAVSAKLGEGVGWTPAEIAEAAPIFGRVAHKWIGDNAYGDEIALASAIIGPPLIRFMMKEKQAPEKMPDPPPYAPET